MNLIINKNNNKRNILEETKNKSEDNTNESSAQTNKAFTSKQAERNDKNFSYENLLSSKHHSFTRNNNSLITAYFYTNTNTILSKTVMSYEEQLQTAIKKRNIELCKELLSRNCNLSKQKNRKLPLNLACENNCFEIVELLIAVSISIYFPVLFA